MWNGSEAYLEMWERASGVPHPGCARSDGEIKAHGFNHLRLGDGWVALLRRAGQPQTRGLAWSWCVAGSRNRHAADVAVLSNGGTVELVGSTARDRTARRVSVGDGAATLPPTTAVGGGVRVIESGSGAWVFAVRRGTIRAVAVASRQLAKRPAALRRAVRRLLAARASQAKPAFKPNATAAASASPGGKVLAGASDPRLNAAFAYLCSMQLQAYGARN
jgi:hypothetical protein